MNSSTKPEPWLALASGEDGVSFLQSIREGRRPQPGIERTLRFGLSMVRRGEVTFSGVPTDDFANPIGSIHGGYAATLLDSAMGAAIHSALGAGQHFTTLELKVNFVRPVLPDRGSVTAIGSVVHLGRRTATAEGRIVDPDGRLLATGTCTCLLFEAEPVSSADA